LAKNLIVSSKKVMLQTFMTTLDYLEQSRKILVIGHKEIIWVWDPVAIKKIKEKGLFMWCP
jgi:hypothetical protein